jgi:hypothetical protein
LSVLLCWSLYWLPFSVGHCIVCPSLLAIVLSVLLCWPVYCLSFSVGHCIVCPSLLAIVLSALLCWPLYCLSFSVGHCIVCLFQTIQWPTERDRQCNGQQRRTDNTMANRKGQTIQ